MTNKKGFELAANFVVMLILGMAVLGASLYIISKYYGKTVEYQKKIDASTQREIENLISRGERVVIPFDHKTVKRGKATAFGLGIVNTLGKTYNFSIEIIGKNITYIDDNGQKIICNSQFGSGDSVKGNTDDNSKISVLYDDITYSIKNNENIKILINVGVGTNVPICQHVYDVIVFVKEGNTKTQYDNTKKIYLDIA